MTFGSSLTLPLEHLGDSFGVPGDYQAPGVMEDSKGRVCSDKKISDTQRKGRVGSDHLKTKRKF